MNTQTTQDKYFLSTPEVFHFCSKRKESEFFIEMIGYHNFHYIPAILFPWKQRYYTLHFVVSGRGHLVINGKKFKVSTHDVFCIDNQCDFFYYPDENEPWEYVFFVFNGSLANEYKSASGFTYKKPIKHCQRPQKIASALSSALQKKESGNTLSYYEVSHLFFMLLDSVTAQENPREFFYNSDFIEEIKSFIQLKYLSPEFSVEYICNSMHISHSHLCRIFKNSEHISIINYINNLKMSYAEELLQNSNSTILEICYMSGYREYEYFLRLFKRIHGISPTQYRKNKKHEDKNKKHLN